MNTLQQELWSVDIRLFVYHINRTLYIVHPHAQGVSLPPDFGKNRLTSTYLRDMAHIQISGLKPVFSFVKSNCPLIKATKVSIRQDR